MQRSKLTKIHEKLSVFFCKSYFFMRNIWFILHFFVSPILVALMAVPACTEQINCPSTFLFSIVAIRWAYNNHNSIPFECQHQPFPTEQFLNIFGNGFEIKIIKIFQQKYLLPLFVIEADFGNTIFFPLWTSSKWVFRLAAFANVLEHSLQTRLITFCWCTREWRRKLYFRSKVLSQISHLNWIGIKINNIDNYFFISPKWISYSSKELLPQSVWCQRPHLTE